MYEWGYFNPSLLINPLTHIWIPEYNAQFPVEVILIIELFYPNVDNYNNSKYAYNF